MKTIKLIEIYIVTVVALLFSPVSANATAIFDAKIGYVFSGEAPKDWVYHVTSGNPGNSESCLSSGSSVPFTHDPSFDLPSLFTVVSLGPPFSGSSSRTRYLTVCKGSKFIIVEMTIHLNSCALWVCSGKWDFTIIKAIENESDYFVGKATIWPDNIDVNVPEQ